MEFGSVEWFEKVKENYNFPVNVAFYISNKNRRILSTEVLSSAINVEDIKYSETDTGTPLLNGERLALLEVRRIENEKEYYKRVMYLKEKWDE